MICVGSLSLSICWINKGEKQGKLSQLAKQLWHARHLNVEFKSTRNSDII